MDEDLDRQELENRLLSIEESVRNLDIPDPNNDESLSYTVVETRHDQRQVIVHWVELPVGSYSTCPTTVENAKSLFLQAALDRDVGTGGDRRVSHGDIMVLTDCAPCTWLCYVASVDRQSYTEPGFQIPDPGSAAETDAVDEFVRRELVVWTMDSPTSWCADFPTVGVDNATSSSSAAAMSTLTVGTPAAGSSINVDHFEVSIGVPLGSFSLNSFDVTVGSASYEPSYEQTACCTDVSIGSSSLQAANTVSLGTTTWVSLGASVQSIIDVDTRAISSTASAVQELVDSVSLTLSDSSSVNTSCSNNPKFMDYGSVSLGVSLGSTLVKVSFDCLDGGYNQCMVLEPVRDVTQTLQKHVINKVDADFTDTTISADVTTTHQELTATTKTYNTQTKRLVINTTDGKLSTTNERLLKLSEQLVNLYIDSTPNTLKPYTQTVAFPNGRTNLFTNERLSIKNRERTTFTNTTTSLYGSAKVGNLVTSSFDITAKTVSLCKTHCSAPTSNVTSGTVSTVGGTSFVEASSSSFNHSMTTIQAGSAASLGADVSLHSMTVSQSANSIDSIVLDGLSVSLGVTASSTLPLEYTDVSLGNITTREVSLSKLTASIANYGSPGTEAISSLAFASASSGGDSASTVISSIACTGVSLGAVSIYGNKLDISTVSGTQAGKKGYIPYLDGCPVNGEVYAIEDASAINLGGVYPDLPVSGFVSLGSVNCGFILSASAEIPVRRYDVDCGVLADKDGAAVNKTLNFNINTGLVATKIYEESVTIGANTHSFLTREATAGGGGSNVFIGCMMTYTAASEDGCCYES